MNLLPIISSYISIVSPYILHITEDKDGLIVFVKSHIPSRRLNNFKIPSNIQITSFEINLRKEKCLVALIYNASPSKNKSFLWHLVEFYSTRYEKVIILGVFNIDTGNRVTEDFL